MTCRPIFQGLSRGFRPQQWWMLPMFSRTRTMWLEKGAPTLILVLLSAASLAGCFGSSSEAGWFGSSSNEATGPFGEPLASGGPPRQDTSKTNGSASGGMVPGQATVPASGPRTARAPALTSAATPVNGAYTIGPLDVLDISVFQVPELTKSVQVADTGTVNLPLVGEIPAAGRTAQQLERDLTSRLGATYLQNPQVTVYVKDYNSQRVTISGAIKKPGVYPIKGNTSLLQLVSMAEGMDTNSDWTVLVIRQSNGQRSAAKFDVNEIEKGRADDPIMQAGDKIVAGTSAIKTSFNTVLKALPIAGVFATGGL
jgi:polysaccharide biosynthesis/export protein